MSSGAIKVDDVDEHGTAIGTVHRTWGDVKAKLGGSDHTLLETAEQGEEVPVAAYETALRRELLLPIRRLLTAQHAHVKQVYERVRMMRLFKKDL